MGKITASQPGVQLPRDWRMSHPLTTFAVTIGHADEFNYFLVLPTIHPSTQAEFLYFCLPFLGPLSPVPYLNRTPVMQREVWTVWNQCLQIVRESVPDQSYKTWFEPVMPLRLDGKVLTIQVPSQFFYEWLEENFVHVLRKALDTAIGRDGMLEYSIIVDNGDEKNRPLTVNVPTTKSPQNAKPDNVNADILKSPFQLKDLDSLTLDSYLNPTYAFDNYVEGDCNRLARSAGFAVAQRPGIAQLDVRLSEIGVLGLVAHDPNGHAAHLARRQEFFHAGHRTRARHPWAITEHLESPPLSFSVLKSADSVADKPLVLGHRGRDQPALHGPLMHRLVVARNRVIEIDPDPHEFIADSSTAFSGYCSTGRPSLGPGCGSPANAFCRSRAAFSTEQVATKPSSRRMRSDET